MRRDISGLREMIYVEGYKPKRKGRRKRFIEDLIVTVLTFGLVIIGVLGLGWASWTAYVKYFG